jgi:hypothetical protein
VTSNEPGGGTFPYSTAQAFGAALTDRLKAVAAGSPYSMSQLRRQFAYDRLLARLFRDPVTGWVLKGGIAMIARLQIARHSADVDLAAALGSPHDALVALRIAAAIDLGDFFTFGFDQPRSMVQGIDGIRVAAQAWLGPRSFERFGVDLVTTTVVTGIVERADPILDLGIPGLVRPSYRLYPLVDVLADKFMGIIERHGERPSTRFRDLVDIVLIARSQMVDAAALCAALVSEGRRRELALPERFDIPDHALWEAGYRTVAQEVPGVPERTLAAAVVTAQRLFDPVLDGRARGQWDPHSLHWVYTTNSR